MKEILRPYRQLLEEVDAWYARCLPLAASGGCRGCSECCRGLFDVTLLDAALLREGFDRLPADTRGSVLERVRPILARLRARYPLFDHPYLLDSIPDEERPLPGEEETPCPLLDEAGRCLLYAYRPLTCRLYGLPHIDFSGEIFLDEWCLHTLSGGDPMDMPGLRWHFRRAFVAEGRLLSALAAHLSLPTDGDLDTLIPTALLIDWGGARGW